MLALATAALTLLPLSGLQTDASQSISARVEGEGYLRFAREGRIVYAKVAALTVEEGQLSGPNGARVLPSILIPTNGKALRVDGAGAVSILAGENRTEVGRLLLAKFAATESLTAQGAYLLARSRPTIGFPETAGFGSIVAEGAAANVAPAQPKAEPDSQGKSVVRVFQPDAPGTLTVVVEPRVEVSGARVLLGEIATLSGPGVETAGGADFGPTPPIGVPMRINRERILSKLAAQGFKRSQVELQSPDVIEVWRKGQRVTQSQFSDAAIALAAATFGNSGAWSSADTAPDFIAPIGSLSLKVESLKPSPEGAAASVAVFVSGRRVNSRTVSLACSIPLVEGAKAGQPVKVKFVIHGIVAEVDGRAKSSGYIGQSIEVLVSLMPGSPPTSHFGTIVAPGHVEVKL